MIAKLSKEEKATWEIDVTKINWKMFLANFAYGLKKFVLKEQASIPTIPATLDLNEDSLSTRYLSDFQWAYNMQVAMSGRTLKEIRALVLNSQNV